MSSPTGDSTTGEPVNESDLDAWLRDDLFAEATADKDEAGLYGFRSEGLERMIYERLLEREAERQGVDVAELHERATAGASVSDDEVESVWVNNRERLVDSTFEEMAPRIRAYLESQKRAQA